MFRMGSGRMDKSAAKVDLVPDLGMRAGRRYLFKDHPILR